MTVHVSEDDIRKALVDTFTAPPSEDISRQIMAAAGIRPDRIEKAIATGSGLVAYDLQAPAKNLFPVNTPLIKRIPRIGGGTGTATNWKAVNAITGSGWDNSGWVPEGQRAGQMSYTTSSKSAAYATLGEEDQATWEAVSAGRTFEDVRATMTMRLINKTKLKEESAVLFGNGSLSLGTPSAPTLSASGSGATLGSATYSVIVVALTMEGYRNSSVAGGVATSKTVTGADGKTFTINGGSSQKSANATQAVTLGQTLFCTATPIQGAVAYAWYVGTAGSEKLEKITTINSVTFTAPLAGTGQAATAVTADCSNNSGLNAYDGLLTTALKNGSGAYISSLATGTAGTGTTLTASGKGSCTEVDQMMQTMWDNYQCSVSLLLVNSQQQKDLTTRALSSGSAPLLQYFQNPADGEVKLTAGSSIEFYFNPYLNKKIPIIVHPQVAPGTIIGWAEDLPAQYMSNEVPNVAEMKVRRDYYQVDWPVTTRADMVGVYVEETLAVYAPFAMGVITNIAPG
jgi:hypothetical protein